MGWEAMANDGRQVSAMVAEVQQAVTTGLLVATTGLLVATIGLLERTAGCRQGKARSTTVQVDCRSSPESLSELQRRLTGV